MSYENYTETGREILRRAAVLAGERGHTYLGSEHILLAMTCCGGAAEAVLRRYGVTYEEVSGEIDELIGRGTPCVTPESAKTENVRAALETAERLGGKAWAASIYFRDFSDVWTPALCRYSAGFVPMNAG